MNEEKRGSRMGQSVRALGVGSLLVAAVLAGAGRGSRVNAQDATPVAGTSPAVVTVLGEGSVTVKPDIATVTVGVQVTKPTLPEAQNEATKEMTRVLKAIAKDGIKDDDVQTAYYSVNVLQNYDNSGNPTEVTGYQVSNQVNVTVRDLDKVGPLLEDVVAAGANSIYGITFGLADPSAAQSQARAAAVADAKTRAEELAQAAGLSLGRVLAISEGVAQPVPYVASQGAGGKAGAPIQPGSTQVTVDVQVTYELV
ncbi:MAG TPA: SIMPL domain-containing protein [Thermomicrobiales bacterium]|jgi:uncharacterized protein YggE